MFLLGFTGPIDRIKLLKPVVLVPVPSGSFDHQLGLAFDSCTHKIRFENCLICFLGTCNADISISR
jgi:hypothetical protein